MGLISSVDAKSREDFLEITKNFFEPQLAQVGLSVTHINDYNLQQLQEALERINDAINNPDSFGLLNVKLSPKSVFIVTTESQIQLGILPLLLERKSLILDKIRQFKENEKIDNLQDLVKNVQDENLKKSFTNELNILQEDARKFREEKDGVIKLQTNELKESQFERIKLQRELFESRARIIRSFLERESVATIVGSLIIIMFGFLEIVAVFLKISVPSELHNILVLVLGYFFGQYSTRGETLKQSDKEINNK